MHGEGLQRALALGLALCAALAGVAVAHPGGWMLFGALALAGLILLALVRSELATLAFCVVLYTNTMVVAVRFHDVPAFASSLFVSVLLIPLASALIIRRERLVLTPTLWLMAAWLVVMMLSAVLGGSTRTSITMITTFALEGLVLYALLTNVIRRLETLRRVIWALLIAGGLLGALSLYQDVTRTYENPYAGYAQVELENGGIETPDGEPRFRLGGPIGEKNRYAQILIVLLPLAFFRAVSERRLALRFLAGGLGLLILSGMALTYSRGALVGLAGVLILMVAWRYIRLHQLLLAGLVAALLVTSLAPATVERVVRLQDIGGLLAGESEGPDGAVRGRLTQNLSALHTFLDYPLFGVGPGAFFREYSQKNANDVGFRFLTTNRRAHNMYLEIAADVGAVGLAVFMAIIAVTCVRLWQLRRYWLGRDSERSGMAAALLLGMAAYLITALFLQLSFERYYWFQIAVANAAISILAPAQEGAPATAAADAQAAGVAQAGAAGRT
ncbi:MAG: hypothetical protein RLZZ387_4619 [Chloroflexota bacterium]